MPKVTIPTLSTDRLTSISAIQSALDAIGIWSDNVLTRDGTFPNFMQDLLDMNSNNIINLATPTFGHHAATKAYVDAVIVAAEAGEATSTVIGDLQTQIDGLDSRITDNDSDIAARATITYVDTVSTDLTAAIATSETTITAAYTGAITFQRQVNSNLIQNPSGADGLNGWTNTANWTTDSSPIGDYFTTTTVGVQTINSTPISVTVGEAYALSFKAGGETFTAGAANLIWRNGSGSTISTESVSIVSQDSFPGYELSSVAPAGAVDVIVQFTCNLSSGFFLFQKAKLEQANAPTMFTDDVFIVTSTANISTNATAIATNSGSIASLTTTVSSNTSAIATNTGNISTNTASISSNATAITSNTGSISSLTTTVTANSSSITSNTASITTNATAITTVDGKLSAKYALTVDANGRIAQLALLSDGTTSSIVFKADTFKIFDGTSSDIAPFSVSGGVVTMTNVRITGDLIVDNAVSEFEGNSAASGTTLTKDTWVTVASDSITTSGGRVIINGSSYVNAVASTAVITFARIRRGTTTVLETGALPTIEDTSGDFYTAGIVPVVAIDEPSAGTYTYTYEIMVDVNAAGVIIGTAEATDRTIYLQEFKK